MKRFLLLACLGLSLPASAQVTIIVPAVTHHVFNDAKENDRNWGAGVEYGLRPSLSLIAEDYENSDSRNTLAIGAAWLPLHFSRFRAGGALALDLTRGYLDNPYWPLIGDGRATFQVSAHWGVGLDVIPSPNIGMSLSVRYVVKGVAR